MPEDQGIVSPSTIRSHVCEDSPTGLPKCELNEDINGHAKVDMAKPIRPQSYPKTNSNQGKLGAGEVISREEHTNG